jgi:hypothetical protein
MGGYGNDTLIGGTGNDSADKIVFAQYLPGDVAASRDGSDLLLTVLGTSNQVRVQGWFGNAAHRVETVVFSDGTMWGESRIST